MTYDITKAGTGLKIVTGDGARYDVPDPVLDYNPELTYPAAAAAVEISGGTLLLRLTASDTVTVNGAAGAGTLSGLFTQLIALF